MEVMARVSVLGNRGSGKRARYDQGHKGRYSYQKLGTH
jgi:hypothetical protein